jgi:molybdopterin-binding protein
MVIYRCFSFRPCESARVVAMRLSARNQLAGTVVSVDLGAVMATVIIRLEGGQEVVSAITKDSAERLGLTEGDSVTAIIKATEVMVGKD